MTGLLVKDFCILKKQLTTMLIFVLAYAVWSVAAKSPAMMGVMTILMSIMLPITSLSFDEYCKWNRYAFSMPIARRTLVLSKYVLGFLVALAGIVISSIGNLVVLNITGGKDAIESWISIACFAQMGVIFLSIILPLLFKFGVEKGRFLMIAIAVIPSVLVVSLASWLETSGISMPSEEVLKAIFLSSPLFTLAVFLVSFRITVGICRKKEY